MTVTAWMYYKPTSDTTGATELNDPVAPSPLTPLMRTPQSNTDHSGERFLRARIIDNNDGLLHITITSELIPPCPLNNPSKTTTKEVKADANHLYTKIPIHDSSAGCFSSKTKLCPYSENLPGLDNEVVKRWEERKRGLEVRFVYRVNHAPTSSP